MKKKIFLLVLFSVLVSGATRAQTWSPVGSGMSNLVQVLGVYNGELYAGGFFTTAGGVSVNHIAKWNGASWSSVGSGMDSTVTSLAVYNGELYAGGFFTTAGGISANLIAKWNGSSWSAAGSGMSTWDSDVNALAVYNGDLYAGGYFITAGNVPANSIAKWNGSNWSTVGSGIEYGIFSLAVYHGELYAGGNFTTMDGIAANCIAKWNGTSWSPVGTGVSETAGGNESVYSLVVYNDELYAGGYFTTAGGISINYISKWNGTSWSPVGSGTNSRVFSLAVNNGELYAGGEFTTAGGLPANNIAKWNGTSWSDLGSGMSSTLIPSQVYSLASYSGELYAGGYFTTAGGISANYIAKWSNCSPPTQPGPITGNTLVCSGSTQIYSVSPVSGATSYIWTLPSGWTGTSTTNSIAATIGVNSGNISVTPNNSCGNGSAQVLALTVISNQAQPGSITGSNPACKGSSQTYSINAVSGATSYTWILPTGWTGTSSTNSITATVGSNSGNISVTPNNSCDYSSPPSSLMVMVNADPVQPGLITGNITASAGQTFNYSISSVSNATGFNWSLSGGGSITSGQNTSSVSVNWLKPGNYSLFVNAKNSCGVSNNQILNVTVIDPDNPFQIKVTPNPSSGDFYLTAKGVKDKEMHIEIFNLLGQKIYSDQQRAGTNNYSMLLNLEKVASGVYVVKIIIDEKVYLRTIVKIG